MRFINETTAFKIMVDGHGVMFSITTKSRSYNFFLTGRYAGGKVAPTTDPYPGIVEICGYNIDKILANWDLLYRIKFTDPAKYWAARHSLE